LNAFDNATETRATVVIFYGNRVDDIRIQGGVINTLQARMGTGGNNMPMICYPIQDGRGMDKKQNGLGIGEANDPAYTVDTVSRQAMTDGGLVGRLTPVECERLQGFPDNWTAQRIDEKKGLVDQADSSRYKQMGNAVAVPCVQWIIERLVEHETKQD
jgi:DNA (cytosine-5)-methyltransferase 1